MTCPIHPPHPLVSYVHSPSTHLTPIIFHCLSHCFCFCFRPHLIDFRSTSNFILGELCRQLNFHKRINKTRYKVQSITGKLICQENVYPATSWSTSCGIHPLPGSGEFQHRHYSRAPIAYLAQSCDLLVHWQSPEVER